jgi:hypothetical protein
VVPEVQCSTDGVSGPVAWSSKTFDGQLVQHEGALSVLEGRSARVHHQHRVEPREPLPRLAYFVEVLLLRDDRGGLRVVQAHPEGIVAERGKQRLCDAAHLEDRQETDVQLRHPIQEQADPIAGAEANLAQVVRHGVGAPAKVVERIRAGVALKVLPDEGAAVAVPLEADPVGAIPAHVQRVTGRPIELAVRDGPVEGADAIVVARRRGSWR